MTKPAGYHRLVWTLAVGQVINWATVYYGFSSFVLPMMADLGWSKPSVMGANTLGLLVWGLTTYAAGAAIDRGHARALMTGGCLAAGLGFAVWALARQPWMLYVAWVFLGAASSATLYEPAFNVITRRYPDHYREGITTLTLLGGLASTLSFPLVAALNQALGWRGALGCLALLMAGVMAPLHAWALRGPHAVVASARGHDAEDAATLRQALGTSAFWLLTLCFTLYAIVMSALWAHMMPMLAGKGFSQADALAVIVGIGPAQVAGRLVFSLRGQALSLRRLGLFVLAAIPVALLLFAIGQTLWLMVLAGLIYGVANGLVTIVRGGLVPAYFGRTHIGRIGGAMSGIGLVTRSIGPVAVAWWLLWQPGYGSALVALAAVSAVAVVCFALARRPGRFRAQAVSVPSREGSTR